MDRQPNEANPDEDDLTEAIHQLRNLTVTSNRLILQAVSRLENVAGGRNNGAGGAHHPGTNVTARNERVDADGGGTVGTRDPGTQIPAARGRNPPAAAYQEPFEAQPRARTAVANRANPNGPAEEDNLERERIRVETRLPVGTRVVITNGTRRLVAQLTNRNYNSRIERYARVTRISNNGDRIRVHIRTANGTETWRSEQYIRIANLQEQAQQYGWH